MKRVLLTAALAAGMVALMQPGAQAAEVKAVVDGHCDHGAGNDDCECVNQWTPVVTVNQCVG